MACVQIEPRDAPGIGGALPLASSASGLSDERVAVYSLEVSTRWRLVHAGG